MNSAVALTFIPCFVILLIAGSGSTSENTVNDNFVTINSCTCEGYNNVYECTVNRESDTLWTGIVFDCPRTNNEILFLSGILNTVNAICNNGAISGRVVRADNDCYTSQLSILVTYEMIGGNVSCYDDGMRGTILIGSTSLILTTDPLPPPDDIRLINATNHTLIFQWTLVSQTCAAIQYSVEPSKYCGDCPNVTDQTTIACTSDVGYAVLHGQQCRLTVRTIVCDNVTGNQSEEVVVMLKVPDAPSSITAWPKYAYPSNKLLSIITSFSESKPVNISEGIDGHTLRYTINYSNATSGVVCKSLDIQASECSNETCKHNEMTPFSVCSDLRHVSVTVSATNQFGTGQLSNAITVDTTNQFVGLSFDTTSKTFTCTFPSQQPNTLKWCNVSYGLPRAGMTVSECCYSTFLANTSTSDSVYLTESGEFESGSEYCFTAMAGNDSFTVIVEGTFDTGAIATSCSASRYIIVGASVGSLVIVIITVTLISIIVVLIRQKRDLNRVIDTLRDRERSNVEETVIYEEPIKQTRSSRSQSPDIDMEENRAYQKITPVK